MFPLTFGVVQQYEKRQKAAKDDWLKLKAAYEHRDGTAAEDGSTIAASVVCFHSFREPYIVLIARLA